MVQIEEDVKVGMDFLQDVIKEHRVTFDPDNINDLVDLYLEAEQNDFKDNTELDGGYTYSCSLGPVNQSSYTATMHFFLYTTEANKQVVERSRVARPLARWPQWCTILANPEVEPHAPNTYQSKLVPGGFINSNKCEGSTSRL